MDIVDKIFQSLGLEGVYDSLFDTLFTYTLKKDKDNKSKYGGYPSKTSKNLNVLSEKTGIPFVDHKKRDYTFAPLIDYVMSNTGMTKTWLHETSYWVNMKAWGEPGKHGRLKAQKKMLDAYLEYESKYENISIIENLINQKHPYYIKKILAEYKTDASEYGHSFKDFIVKNESYFKEIQVFFTIEERSIVDSARDASIELQSLVQSSLRGYLLKANFVYTLVDLIIFVIMFGKILIPDIMENFEVNITHFSPPIRYIERMSYLLINRWFILTGISVVFYTVSKTKLVGTFIDYLKLKIPVVKDYVVADELSKFLKTYLNIMGHVTPRQSFEYSYDRLDNAYIKHIMKEHINETDTDMSITAKTLPDILEDIPYINQEYLDMIRQSDNVGRPQEGLEKVIQIVEPRVENMSKKLNKIILLGTTIITTMLVLLFAGIIYKDIMRIIEVSDQMFLDKLRN